MPVQLLINIDVDDLDRAVDFYVRGLGLCMHRRLFDGRVAEMRGAPSLIHLISNSPGSKPYPLASSVRCYDRHWTPVHLDFLVENCIEAVERAVAAGARLERSIETANWGSIATLSDPFGNGFCLIEMKNRGYDEVATNLHQ